MTDVHDRIREFWDRDAETYDRSASHAVSDPLEAAVWRAALGAALTEPPTAVLDVGAGTGSLSGLAAELGYRGWSTRLATRSSRTEPDASVGGTRDSGTRALGTRAQATSGDRNRAISFAGAAS